MEFFEVLVGNDRFSVDRKIGGGGEGDIYLLRNVPGVALKVYKPKLRESRKEKIPAFIALRLASKYPLIKFPISLAKSRDGSFIGFTMGLAEPSKPLHEIYAPGARKIHFPHADYRFIIHVATNIARAVAKVHETGCIIGDINHSGFLISNQGVVSLIDADSFQITSGQRTHYCEVAVPEYTPPELFGCNLDSTPRTANHDAFGLAVVLFQLLFMGRHPFVGTVRRGEIPQLHENIKALRYVYSDLRNVGMDQPPGTPSVAAFNKTIASYFETAFSIDGVKKRPSAAEWVGCLMQLQRGLVQCEDNRLHYIPDTATDCPWCELESQYGNVLFAPYLPVAAPLNLGDPGRVSFDLNQIWSKIKPFLDQTDFQPKLPNLKLAPSQNAQDTQPKTTSSFNSVFIGIVGLALLVWFPKFFILWLILIWWGFSKSSTTRQEPLLIQKIRFGYQSSVERYKRELVSWENRVGVTELRALKQKLVNANTRYQELLTTQSTEITKFHNNKRDRQLHIFLDRYDVKSSKIKGLGPARLAALKSYGIDSAADITEAKVLAVPGFGEEFTQKLLGWRRLIEKKFIFQSADTELEKQAILQIKLNFESKLSPHRATLNSGMINLQTQINRVRKVAGAEDISLNAAYRAMLQFRADLEFLGIDPGSVVKNVGGIQVTKTASSPPVRPASVPRLKPSGGTNSSTPTCSRCGSAMLRRMARRGKNAGSYFWGCSRYPHCKGTRNI